METLVQVKSVRVRLAAEFLTVNETSSSIIIPQVHLELEALKHDRRSAVR
jgi:hypothetical protein